MKEIKENAEKVSDALMKELNLVLQKFNLGNVHIESIRLKQGHFNVSNCRKICKLWTDPHTGERKVICRMICN